MGNIDFRDPNVQIAGAIIFLSVAVGYFFFFSPMLPFGFQAQKENIAALEVEYERLSADLMKAKQTASRLPQVKAEYEALVATWEEAKTMLPTDKEMAELLSQVTVSGQRAGVDFLLFEPKPPAPKEIYLENPIDVTVQGGFHEIGLFLGRLSNLPRIVNVKSMDLKNMPNPVDTDLPDVVQADVQLAAYVLNPGSASRPATAPAPARPAANRSNGGRRGH